MAKSKKHFNYIKRKKKQKENTLKAEKLFPRREFEEYWQKHSRDIARYVYLEFLECLANDRIFVRSDTSYGFSQKQEIHKGNIEKFCAELPGRINGNVLHEIMPGIDHVIFKCVSDSDNMSVVDFVMNNNEKAATKTIMRYLRESKKTKKITDYIRYHLTEMEVYRQISVNPHYSKAAERISGVMAAKQLLFESIQTSTPDDYTELFPKAREIKRKFILHIGPTNSGKTYQAMEELKAADSGIYLAPLRLLAYEQYERMNREGCPCSMITGEEQLIMPGAFHQSSTIEMANLKEEWDMAVIDEAQMVSDTQRGGSWTSAILGLCAPVIHLCASQDAESTLIKMIKSCGDDIEVVYHERKTPLEMDENATDFRFPQDVQKGDALIVFTRKDVHSVAAELQEKGIKCSIIYGSLPYDVRHREAGKFADGKTDVVVATDAIGMGMNLPIRRVVFLQTVKFDGVKERPLTASEVKQIAGRAGRYGLYDTGYVTSYYDYWMIEKLLSQEIIPIRKAMISIPEGFLSKDGKVSTILEMWNRIPASDFYDKGDISEKIKVAKALESIDDNRELIRKFIRIPANPDNKDTFSVYTDFYKAVARGRDPELSSTMQRFDASDVETDSKNAMQQLEMCSTVFDFLYSFTRLFGDEEDLFRILETKRNISEKIFVILDKQKLSLRACPICGKRLKWSYQFSVCQECYRKKHYNKFKVD